MSSSHGPDGSDLKGVQVLVVEDTWHVAKAMKALLEGLEMIVIGPTATTADARRLIALNNPRLALVDINLKHEMACGLIDELHARGTAVIVVSGYQESGVGAKNIAQRIAIFP